MGFSAPTAVATLMGTIRRETTRAAATIRRQTTRREWNTGASRAVNTARGAPRRNDRIWVERTDPQPEEDLRGCDDVVKAWYIEEAELIRDMEPGFS